MAEMVNGVRDEQHERIQDLEKQVKDQEDINKSLEAYIDRIGTAVEDLQKEIEQLKYRIGDLEQPGDQDNTINIPQDQGDDQSDMNNSTDEEDSAWEVDYEPSEQEKSNRQSIWEFLTDSVDDIDKDKDTSWYTYQDLVDFLDIQEDDTLEYDDVQDPKAQQDAIRDFLRLSKEQGVLTRKQYKRLTQELQGQI
ncbi:hypothetical protein FRC10_004468 [Ceratobasidium sp. 414]|nr:hypothetical protein FRC10_004468 [Ceratobasidium sp. 414]